MKIFFEIPELTSEEIKAKTFEKLAGKIKKGRYIFSSSDSGMGKSTIVDTLACVLSAKGFKVLVVNTDAIPRRRTDAKAEYELVELTRERNADKLKELCKSEEYDYILIDTAPIMVPHSLLRLVDNVSELCDGYYYIINDKRELADWRCTGVILNNPNHPARPRGFSRSYFRRGE